MSERALALALLLASSARADCPRYYPPDFGGVDFSRDYGVRCDGQDETAKILAGIGTAASNAELGGRHFALLPAGDCVVSDRLAWRALDGEWQQQLVLAGRGKEHTRLHLAASSPGYGSAVAPRALLYTASRSGQGCGTFPDGAGACGFFNGIADLDIVIEPGNPGAVGIDFLANNAGAVRNVDLRTAPGATAHTGIEMTRRYPGPAVLEHVTVTGFPRGLKAYGTEYHMTLRDVRLEGFTMFGISDYLLSLSIHGLRTRASKRVSILNLSSTATLSVTDSTFENAHPSQAVAWAIAGPEGGTGVGVLSSRALTTAGLYSATLKDLGSPESYAFPAAVSAFPDDPRAPLALPMPDPPEPYWSNEPADWVNVADFVADPNDPAEDWTPAFVAAFATGRPMVYVPSDRVVRKRTDVTLEWPAHVLTFVGFNATWRLPSGYANPTPVPTFVFTAAGPSAAILGVVGRSGSFSGLRQNSPREVLIRDSALGRLELEEDSAPVHLSAAITSATVRAGASLYAHSLNSESGGAANVRVEGGTFRANGYKQELPNVAVECLDGARCQIDGGLVYAVGVVPPTLPMFRVVDACFYAAISMSAYQIPQRAFATIMEETRGGETQTIPATAFPPKPQTYGRKITVSAQSPGCEVAP